MKIYTTRFVALVLAIALPFLSKGQSAPTWSENIAPIVYQKCSGCHHPGAIGPFSLMSYADAFGAAVSMMDAVNDKRMPPWPPDPTYSHLAHERVLTDGEIQLINDWVNGGSLEGNASLAPPPPVFNDASQIGTVDLTKRIPDYTIQSSEDEYHCFAIPSGLSTDEFIKALEVIPGNRAIVHHVLIFYDTTGQCAANDAADPAPGYTCGGGGTSCGDTRLIGTWVPGSTPTVYPNGMGVPLQANGWFVLQVHYAPGSQGQNDSTRINIKFTNTGGFTRPVYISAPLEHTYTLTNGPLIIPANQVKSFHSQYQVSPVDFSILAVGPHMHLIGISIEAFGVNPAAPNDTIKFIRIPEWDFHWQGAYMFPKLVKVPNGTMLHANATYDNTDNNPENPNNPPQYVFLGEGTEDEMMLVYFAYTFYLPGDENIILDSASVFNSMEVAEEQGTYFDVYPNPANENATVYFNALTSTKASLRLYDAQGRLVKEWWDNKTLNGGWMQEQIDLDGVAPGMYMLSLETDGKQTVRKLSVF